MSSVSSNAISCTAGPAILRITPSLGPYTGGTVLRIAAGYFAQPAASCGGAWCRLAPYRLACVFNYTFFSNTPSGPMWHSQLWLANTTRQVRALFNVRMCPNTECCTFSEERWYLGSNISYWSFKRPIQRTVLELWSKAVQPSIINFSISLPFLSCSFSCPTSSAWILSFWRC